MPGSILSFNNLKGKHNPTQAAANGMIFISKWPWLPWDNNESRTCELTQPFACAFIQASDRTRGECIGHIFIPSIQHVAHSPKAINFLRCIGQGECEGAVYILKAPNSEAKNSFDVSDQNNERRSPVSYRDIINQIPMNCRNSP